MCACGWFVCLEIYIIGFCRVCLFNALLPCTDMWSWSTPKVKGQQAPPLAAHGCAVIDQNVFVFGGLSPTLGASDQLYCLKTGEAVLLYSTCILLLLILA